MCANSHARTWTASEPAAAPPDRRDPAARAALLDRVRGEFREMRGVPLSETDAARLMGVPRPACARILDALMREGALRVTVDGRYIVADALP